MTSVLLHTATHFKLTISSSFQSQSTLFWELFKWEKICNLVQIGGIVMFNNFFYYVNNFCIEICIDFCLYMLSIIVLRKKIVIGKNRYRQVTLPKKSESAKKIAIGESLVLSFTHTHVIANVCFQKNWNIAVELYGPLLWCLLGIWLHKPISLKREAWTFFIISTRIYIEHYL